MKRALSRTQGPAVGRKPSRQKRRPAKQIAERLAEVLNVAPEERTDFLRFARGDPFAAPAALPAEPTFEILTRRELDVLALLAQGDTAPEIALKLVLAVSSVKSHVQHIYGKLGVNSKRQAQSRVRQLGLLGTTPPTASAEPLSPAPAPHSPKHNPPVQLTSFIGREKEIADLKRLLSEPDGARLLTLIGPGGTGKTRLAIEAATSLLDPFPDGVWLVELAPLADPALVPQTMATLWGWKDVPSRPMLSILVDHVRARWLLLVLDNREHLIQVCAEMAEALLHGCPLLQLSVGAGLPRPIGIKFHRQRLLQTDRRVAGTRQGQRVLADGLGSFDQRTIGTIPATHQREWR